MGKVLWHSLTEDGKVEVVDIQFGDKKYENVSVKHLNPTDESSHSHKRTGKELDNNKKKKKNENMKESHHDRKEGKMAKYDAKEIAQDAADVFKMIEESDDLPEWLEAKITLAADYMNKVKDYMTHYVRGTEPAPSYNKPVMKGDFVPSYPMVIKTQDEMKDLMKEIMKKLESK